MRLLCLAICQILTTALPVLAPFRAAEKHPRLVVNLQHLSRAHDYVTRDVLEEAKNTQTLRVWDSLCPNLRPRDHRCSLLKARAHLAET